MGPNLATFLNLQWGLRKGYWDIPSGQLTMERPRWGDLSMGRLRPEVQTLTFLHTIFDRKDIPFVYLLWCSIHKASLELNIPLTAANSLSFK